MRLSGMTCKNSRLDLVDAEQLMANCPYRRADKIVGTSRRATGCCRVEEAAVTGLVRHDYVECRETLRVVASIQMHIFHRHSFNLPTSY